MGAWIGRWAYRVLALVTAANVFAMMAIMFVDVFARYLFNAPLRGAYEVIGFMLAVLVFGSLPLVTRDREHITVEIVEAVSTPSLRRLKDVTVALACAAILGLMSWRMAVHAEVLRESQQITGYLEMPIHPVAWFISVACAASAISALGVALRRLPPGERA